MDYLKLLNKAAEDRKIFMGDDDNAYNVVADIFGFETYDGDVDVLFVTKAMEVCRAITNCETFEYIKDRENYHWYLLILHLPFFASKVEWGGSIRGAWWDEASLSLERINWAWNGDEQLERLEFNKESWTEFLGVLEAFLANVDLAADPQAR